MKISNTSERLKQIMKERNLRQIDILNLTAPYCEKYQVKMNKSDISQYVSGKNEPSQDKLVVLGMALNVSEAWLMGFEVQKARADHITDDDIANAFANDYLEESIDSTCEFSPSEKEHFKNYIQLLEINRKKVDDYTMQLLSLQQMEFELQAAHERTDKEVTDDMVKHDDEIMNNF